MSNRLEVFLCKSLYFSSISENLSFCWSIILEHRKPNKQTLYRRTPWTSSNPEGSTFANLPGQSSAGCQRQQAQNTPEIHSCVASSSFRLRFVRLVFPIGRVGHLTIGSLRLLPLLHLSRHFSTPARLPTNSAELHSKRLTGLFATSLSKIQFVRRIRVHNVGQ